MTNLPATTWDCLTDDEILESRPWQGYKSCYWDWEGNTPETPCMDKAKNAWHVKVLAWAMHDSGRWVGPKPRVDESLVMNKGSLISGQLEPVLVEGHHRVRAVKYLRDSFGVSIEVPW